VLLPTYTLTVLFPGFGSGQVQAQGMDCSVNCEEDYSEGELVTLSAEADEDSEFSGWSGGDCSGTETCVVTMNQAVEVTAQFNVKETELATYVITASTIGGGSISLEAQNVAGIKNIVSAGSTLIFDITANMGHRIADVTVDGESKGIVESVKLSNIEADHAISATFSVNSFNLATVVKGEVSVDHRWKSVKFDQTFSDPVVIAKPASLKDVSPAVVRLRNVDKQGFDIRIQEWDYLDGPHAYEQVSYIVMERGSHALAGSTRIEAGTFNTHHTRDFEGVDFGHPFVNPPIVLTSIASNNEEEAVTGRIKSVSATGFQYRLQEQSINALAHATEKVFYLAWQPSSGQQNGVSFEVGKQLNAQTQGYNDIYFDNDYAEAPLFFADLQTTDGSDGVSLRWTSKNIYSVSVLLDLEQSSSRVISSSSGVIGYLALSEQVRLDSDGDCLFDDDEISIYHTDPQLYDTDDDGLPDGKEVDYWGEGVWGRDDDGDGIPNLLDKESRGDGKSDGEGLIVREGCESTGSMDYGDNLFGEGGYTREEGAGGSESSRSGGFDGKRATFDERAGFDAPNRSFSRPNSGFDRSGVNYDRGGINFER